MAMKMKYSSPNNIKALCDKKGVTALWLAKKIGTSGPHMSRLINGQSPLKVKWLLKISAALKVPTNKIAGVDIDSKLAAKSDDTMLGAILGWMMEASDELDIDIPRELLTKLTSFVYKEAIAQKWGFVEAKYMAFAALKIASMATK